MTHILPLALILVACQGRTLDVAMPEACRGAVVDLVVSGAATTLVISREGRVTVATFSGGMLARVEQLGDAARLEGEGLMCTDGEMEDECLRALWAQGSCWRVE